MTNQQYDEISQKLDMLVRLAALSFVKDRPQQEKIMMLSGAGFQPKEIAGILLKRIGMRNFGWTMMVLCGR